MPLPAIVVTIFKQVAVYVITSLITRALAPKPKGPEAPKVEKPEVDEGRMPVEIHGTWWVMDPTLVAWKSIEPPEPIKEKAKKK